MHAPSGDSAINKAAHLRNLRVMLKPPVQQGRNALPRRKIHRLAFTIAWTPNVELQNAPERLSANAVAVRRRFSALSLQSWPAGLSPARQPKAPAPRQQE
jgi:hypothetical protein